MQGKVMWFNDAKGYGFLRPENGHKDVFVYYSAIISDDERKTLRADQKVEFEIGQGEKGPVAVNVKIVNG